MPASFTFDRGYTGHEHLDVFSLINMNGRIYDPATAHFLSPDNYVQNPNSTQSYHRYGYCLNNPLKYTDPDGEFALKLLVSSFYISFIITTNLIDGVDHPFKQGFKDGLAITDEMSNCMQFSVYQNGNTTITAGIDPFGFGVSLNGYYSSGDWSGGASLGIGVMGSFNAWAGSGITYSPGDFEFSTGVGIGTSSSSYTGGFDTKYVSFGGGAGYNGLSYSQYKTCFGDGQMTGMKSIGYKEWSLSMDNDLWGDGGDRYRTGAGALNYNGKYGSYGISVNIYTEAPQQTGNSLEKKDRLRYAFYNEENNNRQTYDAYGFEAAVCFRAGNEYIGYSHPTVGHIFQNKMCHDGFMRGNSPYFIWNEQCCYNGPEVFYRKYNPYSLW